MIQQTLILFAFLLHSTAFCCTTDSIQYIDASFLPVIGKGFPSTQTRYERLPGNLENQVRKPVWDLSKNCSGLAVRFRTNSTTIAARWEVTGDVFMNHFTMTGIKGLDLYCFKNGEWKFVNSARPVAKITTATIIQNLPGTEMEYMLYLPLYDGLKSLEIGINDNAELRPPLVNFPKTDRPVVFYGTSITQGGCASRAGMAYPSILSRMLNRETINLGFSGNGRLDLEIAEAMADIQASCFVIDCLPNSTLKQMEERYVAFIDIIRKKHATTPIILVENVHFPVMDFDQETFKTVTEKNKALKQIFTEFKKKGDKNIFYVSADNLTGSDGEETVDGVHLTDLGFQRMAKHLYPIIRKHVK